LGEEKPGKDPGKEGSFGFGGPFFSGGEEDFFPTEDTLQKRRRVVQKKGGESGSGGDVSLMEKKVFPSPELGKDF